MSANPAATPSFRTRSRSPLLASAVAAAGWALLTVSGAALAQSPTAKADVDTGTGGEDIGIATPESWKEELELASTLLPNFLKTAALDHLGGKGGTAAYVKPGTGALYVNWVKASKPADDPAVEARALLDRLRQEPMNSSSDGGGVEEVSYKEQPNGEAIEARLVWRHKQNETMTSSRTLVWLDGDKRLRVVRAECFFAEEDAKTLSPICVKSLVSLDADDLKNKTATALGDVAPPPTAQVAAPVVAAGSGSGDDSSTASGPTMSAPAGQSNVLYKNDKPPESKGRMRIWFFIFGAILVVFAFWSIGQRKSKGEKDEDEDEDESQSKSEGKDEGKATSGDAKKPTVVAASEEEEE